MPSSHFSLSVSATDGGRPPLSTVATLRVTISDGDAADNRTMLADGVGLLVRSALASDRLATALALLLVGVILTTAVILLSTVIMDRQRRCRLPDKLANCRWLPMRGKRRCTHGSAADVLSVTTCCPCCMDDRRYRKKRKTALSVDDAAATTGDISGSTSTDVTTRRVSVTNESL